VPSNFRLARGYGSSNGSVISNNSSNFNSTQLGALNLGSNPRSVLFAGLGLGGSGNADIDKIEEAVWSRIEQKLIHRNQEIKHMEEGADAYDASLSLLLFVIYVLGKLIFHALNG
jgi:hypothetical protein